MTMQVKIKKPIRLHIDSSQLIKDDGETFLVVQPGDYDLVDIHEYDEDGDLIEIKVTIGAYFWTTDVKEEDWSTP